MTYNINICYICYVKMLIIHVRLWYKKLFLIGKTFSNLGPERGKISAKPQVLTLNVNVWSYNTRDWNLDSY